MEWSENASMMFNEIFPAFRDYPQGKALELFKACEANAKAEESSMVYQDHVGRAVKEMLEG